MAMINCNVNTAWNNDKCQNFAGKHYEKLKPRVEALHNAGKERVTPERSDKQIYHISPNGYYGYLPVLPEKACEEIPMDTNDTEVEIAGYETNEKTGTFDFVKTENVFSVGITLGRRKRVRGEDHIEWSKKQRKTERGSLSESSCLVDNEGNCMDLLENLLKETHGCDLYNYVSCDI